MEAGPDHPDARAQRRSLHRSAARRRARGPGGHRRVCGRDRSRRPAPARRAASEALAVAVPIIVTEGLTKDYHLGPHTVHALRGVSLDDRRAAIRRDHGAVRLGQVDLHEHPRLSRPADRRAVPARRRATSSALSDGRPGARSATARSASSSRSSTCCRARRRSRTSSCRCSTPASGRRERRERARAALAARRARRSRAAIIRTSSPAASSSAWRSRARWSTTRRSFWPTSRPATSTPAPASRSWPCSSG